MTTFRYAIAICGLSLRGAADYLGVSYDTVKSWSQGRNAPPLGVWQELAALLARIENAADHAAGHLEHDLMDRRALNSIQADTGADPLPAGADDAAGALAVLLAVRDTRGS